MNDIMWSSIITAVILVAWAIIFWYFRKPKPKVAICWKCKYSIKQGRFRGRATKISCRNPGDSTEINFITGKKYKPRYSCDLRNKRGACTYYKKVWWRL